MPENNTADGIASAAEQAEKRTDETRAFVRSVRRFRQRSFDGLRMTGIQSDLRQNMPWPRWAGISLAPVL